MNGKKVWENDNSFIDRVWINNELGGCQNKMRIIKIDGPLTCDSDAMQLQWHFRLENNKQIIIGATIKYIFIHEYASVCKHNKGFAIGTWQLLWQSFSH